MVDHDKELEVPTHLTCGVLWYVLFIAIAFFIYLLLVPITKSVMSLL